MYWWLLSLLSVSDERNSNNQKLSCTFNRDTCGWTNVDDNDHVRTWNLSISIQGKATSMKVNMRGAKPNDTGRMASPWLQAKPGSQCQLTFRYFIFDNDFCQLSVIQQTDTPPGETTLWNTTKKSNFSDPQTVNVMCAERPYRVIFEGRQLTKRGCNELVIDNVQFNLSLVQSSTTASTVVSSLTLLTSSSRPEHSDDATEDHSGSSTMGTTSSRRDGSHTGSQTDSKRKLGTGSIVAIVVAVAVVVIILAVVIVLILRRRRCNMANENTDLQQFKRAGEEGRPSSSIGVSRSFSNDGYTVVTHVQRPAAPLGPTINSTEGERENNDSVHIYTTPGDPYVTTGDSDVSNEHATVLQSNDSSAQTVRSGHNYNQLSLNDSKDNSSLPFCDDNYHQLTDQRKKNAQKQSQDEHTTRRPEQKGNPESVPKVINAYDKLVRPNEAKEFSAEKGQHSASLGIPEESHLNQQNGRCSCHANFDNVTSSAA